MAQTALSQFLSKRRQRLAQTSKTYLAVEGQLGTADHTLCVFSLYTLPQLMASLRYLWINTSYTVERGVLTIYHETNF